MPAGLFRLGWVDIQYVNSLRRVEQLRESKIWYTYSLVGAIIMGA